MMLHLLTNLRTLRGIEMVSESLLNATKIFEAMVKGREVERQRAQESLTDPKIPVDKQDLRLRILNALEKDFYPGIEQEQEDKGLSWTRAWLLATLARVCEDDDKAATVLRKHLDPNVESEPWVRYWALEGLIVSKAPDIVDRAKEVIARDKENLIVMLATAILASKENDNDAKERIKKGLEDNNLKNSTLRALRIIPLKGMVTRICKVGDEESKHRLSSNTFNTINALGTIPKDWPEARQAAQWIVRFIEEVRRSPMFDTVRTRALIALGNLEVKTTTPVLVEELTDYNPTIISEAAKALEKVVDIKTATYRVVEAAGQAGFEEIEKYASAFRYMDREAITNELGVIMTSGSLERQSVARRLLSEMGGAAAYQKLEKRSKTMEDFRNNLRISDSNIKNRYNRLISGAEKGFMIVTTMDSLIFGLGLVLIIISALLALFSEGSLMGWLGMGVSGSTGVAGVLYGMYYSEPRKNIKKSVKNLSKYYVLFQGYTHELHQIYQAYTLHLIDERELKIIDLKNYNNMVENTMKEALKQIENIDKSEPKGTKKSSQIPPTSP